MTFEKRCELSPGLASPIGLDAVASFRHSLRVGAMGAAEEFLVLFHSVSDNATSAVEASRSECLNCALKAIERVGMALVDDVE